MPKTFLIFMGLFVGFMIVAGAVADCIGRAKAHDAACKLFKSLSNGRKS